MSSSSSPSIGRFPGLGKIKILKIFFKNPSNFNLLAKRWPPQTSRDNMQEQPAAFQWTPGSISHHNQPSQNSLPVNGTLHTAPSLSRSTACKGSSGAHPGARVSAHTPVPSVLSALACICLLHPESGPLTHRCPEGEGRERSVMPWTLRGTSAAGRDKQCPKCSFQHLSNTQ